ncbi:MAG TPA: GGDEF domain-containing protein [Dyella sp.]|uniref:GGDEF domain-containing protein n=1 Tax=Dyella sp. TaxID=1869338 RepID=UPI002C69F4A4|nr:GGDEF domain-containing protein [Dyella sp.]HTV85587.1 GGDEF domain-containing protein [Dyella sp.]
MQLNVETLALINGGQALVLALMLWYGAHDGCRYALNGLRLRAAAMVAEACGDFVLAVDVHVSPLVVLLLGNGLNLLAQVLTVIALRMVLQRPLLWRTSLAVGVVGWLGVAWLSVIHPSYPERVLWGSTILLCTNGLNIAALWGGCGKRETRAQCVLMWAYVLAIALLVWRNVSLWALATPLQSITAPSPINSFYVLLYGVQPLLASVGFLLLYNEILQRELFDLARIDPLTGVNNRLGLLEASETLLARARARHESIGVLLIDADHFKSINDRFGHDDGDRVLLELVTNIRRMLRAGDMVGRVGGEEFLVLSPAVQRADLLALAERIRTAIERTAFSIEGQSYALTVSIGAALAHGDEADMSGARRRADKALYEAKHAGRNCVRIAAS